jgi:hypothetical protein
MKLLLSISFFLVFFNHSLLIECAEKIKIKSSGEPLLEKSLADNLQKALDNLPIDKIPSEFKQPQTREGDEYKLFNF